jgi:Holliday junction resolvasome RuvABC endonuclease subunit
MVFVRLERYLEELAPRQVAFELVRGHTGTNAAQLYGAWVATVTRWCEARSIPYRGIHTGSVKRHATGNGNAKKEAMMKNARAKLGYEGTNEDEVDALWVLSAYLHGVE